MHLAELRQILEPEIAVLAAARIDEQLLSTMREAMHAHQRQVRRDSSAAARSAECKPTP